MSDCQQVGQAWACDQNIKDSARESFVAMKKIYYFVVCYIIVAGQGEK